MPFIIYKDNPRVLDVSVEPEILLGSWRLVEAELPGEGRVRRLVGCTRSGPERTRISSPIVLWDWCARRAVTESGRVYRLVQTPTDQPAEAALVLAYVAALASHGVTDVTDMVLTRDGAWHAHDA